MATAQSTELQEAQAEISRLNEQLASAKAAVANGGAAQKKVCCCHMRSYTFLSSPFQVLQWSMIRGDKCFAFSHVLRKGARETFDALMQCLIFGASHGMSR